MYILRKRVFFLPTSLVLDRNFYSGDTRTKKIRDTYISGHTKNPRNHCEPRHHKTRSVKFRSRLCFFVFHRLANSLPNIISHSRSKLFDKSPRNRHSSRPIWSGKLKFWQIRRKQRKEQGKTTFAGSIMRAKGPRFGQ